MQLLRPTILRGAFLIAFLAQAYCDTGVVLASPPEGVSADVRRLESGEAGPAIYRIQIKAGGSAAALGLSYELPQWSTTAQVLGSPMRIESVRLIGNGNVRPAAVSLVPKPSLNRDFRCLRDRASSVPSRLWIEVPAGSTSVLELRAAGTYPQWPGTSYRLDLATFLSEELLAEETPLSVRAAPPLSPRGTHIKLYTGNKTQRAPGMSPKVIGLTYPPLEFSRIRVRAVRPTPQGRVSLDQWGAPTSVALDSVRTDEKGRFTIPSQRISGSGRLAFVVRTQPRGARASDWNCGPFFDLKK